MWDSDSNENGEDRRGSQAFMHSKRMGVSRHQFMDPYASRGPSVRAIQVTHTGQDCCCDESYSKECPVHCTKAKDHTLYGGRFDKTHSKPESVGGRRPIDEASNFDGMHDTALRYARRNTAAPIPSKRLMGYHDMSNFDASQYQ